MKICIVATSGVSLTNFRGSLIRSWVNQGHRVVCVSIESESEMGEEIRKLGAAYYQVAGDRVSIGVVSGIKMIKAYRRAFETIKPDMCFLYMSKPVAFGAIAAKEAHVPHINILVNGLENAFYRKSMKDAVVRCALKKLYRKASKRAEHVFLQNQDDYDFFLKHRLSSKDKCSLVHGSGVDMDYFRKKELPKEPVFLMTARLLWSKGIREYLSAIPIVQKACPCAKFILVGGIDCNDEAITPAELRQIVGKYSVEYSGYAKDVRPYLEKSSIYVLPSYHEGCPRSVLEAMSMGRPIITTDAPGCSDTVENGLNGFKVPIKNVAALAEKMIVLANDEALREKMGNESHKICREKFEVNIINKTMNDKMFG